MIEISYGTAIGGAITVFCSLLGLAAAAWKLMSGRITAVDAQLLAKADSTEMLRNDEVISSEVRRYNETISKEITHNREHVNKIYGKLGDVEKDVTGIKIQLGRVVSDIESEKRSRSEANRELVQKLDRLLERRSQPREAPK